MKRVLLAATLVAFAMPAYAGSCPSHIAAIDKALPTAQIDATKKAQVTKLRAEADAAHKAGNHAASLKASAEAKELLGIK